MVEFINKLFSTDFMPHVYCLRLPEVIWLHVVSDALIAASYFLIPAALVLLIKRRRDLAFSWMFALFGLFILACGSTHLLAIYTLWHPVYRFDGAVKAITALASMPTALLLFRLLPQAVALSSPNQLRSEVEQRRRAENDVRQLNAELEHRVVERTAALAASEARFRAAVECVSDIVWTNSADGRMLGEQPGWAAFTGQALDDYREFGWSKSVHPADAQPTLDSWNSAVARRQTFVFEHRVKRHDGVYRLFSVRAVPVIDDAGQIREWVGVHADITEQRRFADALQESEERLRLAQQIAKVGTFDWDIRTGVNRWTPELEAMYGLEPGSFARTTPAWEGLVHPSDREYAVGQVQRSMQSGFFEGEWRVVWPDGTVRWLDGRGRVFKDEYGSPVRMLGVNIDITERKAAEQALRESETRYSTLTEALPAIVYTALQTGETDFVNSRWRQYTGLTFDQSALTGFDEPIHPDDRKVVRERWNDARQFGLPFETEFRLRREDGVYRWFRCNAVPLKNDEGGIVNWLGISSDIDDEKKAEDRLRQSQKMEAIGRLAGGVAHDFNNLLTGISGFNSMLIEAIDKDSELMSFAQEVQKASEKAAGLTRQLLSFSRREISKPKVLELNEVVLSMRTLLERVIGEDIQISTELSAEPLHVRVDPVQLDQVIMNLAVNARDAMPVGGRLDFKTALATVSAEDALERSVEPGRYVTLQISDSGFGMDADTKSHLFEPFFTTKEQGKGTGLGLSTVYGVVQQNSGFISVESEPGHGASFTVHFPESLGSETADIAERSLPVELEGGGGTILLAEDDDIVRQLAAALLRKQGFHVLEASTPSIALKLVNDFDRPILALVSDVLMPEMRGPELARRIRDLRPGLPVLFMSGYSDRALLNPGALDGVLVLQKPFTAAELYMAVRETLGITPGLQGANT